tara:strand:- start:142 stop:393 length:252 start_codon:yes stop_codon:yes gene_type:complete
MKFALLVIMCSAMEKVCLPPVHLPELYEDAYSCYIAGYKKANDKIVEIGREDINEHLIYVKFNCYEVEANKTAVQNQQFKKKI